MTPTFTLDEAHHQFVADVGGVQATVTYHRVDDATIDFVSTYVPHVLRGHSVGTQLVRHALEWARDKNLRVIPSCWFVGSVVERYPQYREVLQR